MTFRDLKLPSNKKRKLELYKCWFVTPYTKKKGNEIRVLELNSDIDRYGLTVEAAVQYELNRFLSTMNLKEEFLKDPIDMMSKLMVVVMQFTLSPNTMDEEVVIPPNNSIKPADPNYDPAFGLISVTLKDRTDCEKDIKNYAVDHIKCELDPNTEIILVNELELREQIIGKSLTGG